MSSLKPNRLAEIIRGLPSLFDIFFGRLARWIRQLAAWRKQGLLRKALEERRRRAIRFESLEPRLLLSADLSYTAMGSADLTLRAGNADGVDRLELIQSNTGEVLASEALANINGSSGFGARIDANGFDVKLTIDATAESAEVIGGIVFEGGAGNSTLEGGDIANVWTLAGSGEGSVGSVRFSGVEKLVGGGAEDALAGPIADTVWTLSGEGSGEVVGVLFEGFENLLGAAGNQDTFVVGASGNVSGVIDGGDAGFDTMVLDGGNFSSVVYVATGPTSGTIQRDGQLITYAGLEPIVDTMTVADRVISTAGTFPVNPDDTDVGLIGDNLDDRATLTSNGDGTHTLASVSVIPTFESVTFNNPTNSLTINLSGDLGIPFLSEDVLTINSFDAIGVDLIVNGEDGKDEVVISGTVTAGDVTINAEKIVISSTVNAGNVTLTAAADDDGAIAGPGDLGGLFDGLFVATPEAVIDLSGATINANGNLTLSATATANITATPSTIGSLLDASLLTILPKASVLFNNTTITADNLTAGSSVNVTAAFEDEADSSDTATTSDAAVSVVVVDSEATTGVAGASTLAVSGAVALSAATTLNVSSRADGSGGTAGATLAVTEVQADTSVFVADSASIVAIGVDAPDSVSLAAALTSSITTTATSTANGAQDGGGGNKSEQRLADPDQDGDTSDKAQTNEGSISFAGAVVVSDYRPVTAAYVDTSGSIVTAGAIGISASSTDSVSATADGSNTAGSGTGVGVAVAIGVVDATTRAYVGGASTLTATDVNLSATMAAGASFTVTAKSGAGNGAETGVAGSLAVNKVTTRVEATIEDGASVTLLGGANLSLSANSATNTVTHAIPNGVTGGATDLGIGASVAVAVIDNLTAATIADGASVTGAADITLAASGSNASETRAEAGGKGSTGFGGALAIDVIDNVTMAAVGTGSALVLSGVLDASAKQHGVATTTADGEALGTDTAIGAAIALAFVENRAAANLNRNLQAGGSVNILASVDGSNKSTAMASAAGADKAKEEGNGNKSADDQIDSATGLAKSQSGDSSLSVGKSASTDDGDAGTSNDGAVGWVRRWG